MKSWKFQVESVLGHLQGGNYEFKIANEYRKIFENIQKWLHHKTWISKQVKEKHSVYKKSVSISGGWRREEMRGRKKEESMKKRGNIVDRWR